MTLSEWYFLNCHLAFSEEEYVRFEKSRNSLSLSHTQGLKHYWAFDPLPMGKYVKWHHLVNILKAFWCPFVWAAVGKAQDNVSITADSDLKGEGPGDEREPFKWGKDRQLGEEERDSRERGSWEKGMTERSERECEKKQGFFAKERNMEDRERGKKRVQRKRNTKVKAGKEGERRSGKEKAEIPRDVPWAEKLLRLHLTHILSGPQ